MAGVGRASRTADSLQIGIAKAGGAVSGRSPASTSTAARAAVNTVIGGAATSDGLRRAAAAARAGKTGSAGPLALAGSARRCSRAGAEQAAKCQTEESKQQILLAHREGHSIYGK